MHSTVKYMFMCQRANSPKVDSTAPVLFHSFLQFLITVRLRGIETELIETILEFASVSLKKIETLLLGSWWT